MTADRGWFMQGKGNEATGNLVGEEGGWSGKTREKATTVAEEEAEGKVK